MEPEITMDVIWLKRSPIASLETKTIPTQDGSETFYRGPLPDKRGEQVFTVS